ncbi:hypothetical protein ACLKA7_003604 [Drosophila subpalustris]
MVCKRLLQLAPGEYQKPKQLNRITNPFIFPFIIIISSLNAKYLRTSANVLTTLRRLLDCVRDFVRI